MHIVIKYKDRERELDLTGDWFSMISHNFL